MTDHRVTDLSYGHLGKAIYDIEGKEWNFSLDTDQGCHIRQLENLKECIPASCLDEHEEESRITPSVAVKSQMRWLTKHLPETLPAQDVISGQLKGLFLSQTMPTVHTGALLAVGHAIDTDRLANSKKRRAPLLALPFGASSHVLQVIVPREEIRAWPERNGSKLSLLDTSSYENAFWQGTGGSIRQIVSAQDDNFVETFLAVRQESIITIFRPLTKKCFGSAHLPGDNGKPSTRSILEPNQIAQLTGERTTSRTYVDVSFNPWYVRQFAVIDDRGCWSLWDIERVHDRPSYFLLPGKIGNIYDGQSAETLDTKTASGNEQADGWHKILWTCNLSTIVVCNRRSIAVFDTKGLPERLQSPSLLPAKSSEWILDVVRSTKNLDHLFVLTTSRIYWIEVAAAREAMVDVDRFEGVRIILSYQHFRSADDESMRLTTITDEHLSVAISSLTCDLVNVYSFKDAEGYASTASSWKTSFSFSFQASEGTESPRISSMFFMPCSFAPGLGHDDLDLRFFQLWTLSADLSLSKALSVICPVAPVNGLPESSLVTMPHKTVFRPYHKWKSTFDDDNFISLHESSSEDDELRSRRRRNAKAKPQDDIHMGLNWRHAFIHAFIPRERSWRARDDARDIPELLGTVSERVSDGFASQLLPLDTFANISGLVVSSGGLDEAASALQEYIGNLVNGIEMPGGPCTLTLFSLAACPGSNDLIQEGANHADLLTIHERLVSYWMSNLPLQVYNPARLSKFKMIRQLGVEIVLNSLGISIQNKAATITNPDHEDEVGTETMTRAGSPALFSSQAASATGNNNFSSIPTPSRTPSIYSRGTSGSELKEDPAVTRLRQYAVSIKTRPDPGKSSLLSHWPSMPGVDPATYSYEAARKSRLAEENGHDSDYKSRKEAARRRKRTEKFLQQDRERERLIEGSSQPVPVMMSHPRVIIPAGSQPVVFDPSFSSQIVDDMPMTQPVGGTFGSRTAKAGKKARKGRKAGF